MDITKVLSSKYAKIGASIGVVCLGYLVFSRLLGEDKDFNDGHIPVRLMINEAGLLMMMPAPTTATRYRVKDANIAIKYLRNRVKDIILKNPWLLGHLAKNKSLGPHLRYKNRTEISNEDIDRVFKVIFDTQTYVGDETPHARLVDIVKDVAVKTGNSIVNKPNETLFRVTVVVSKHETEVCVIFSLCHCIGDGYTFYTLHNMLDKNTEVTAMEVQRPQNDEQEFRKTIGDNTMNWLCNPSLLFGMIGCAVFRSTVSMHVVELDNEWIASEKKRQLAQPLPFFKDGYRPSFLSTNDVICAWFMRHFECDHITVPLNLRNRNPVMHSNMAGNHVSLFLLDQEEEYTSAAGYRRALEVEPRFRGQHDSCPSSLRTLNFNGATISNWSSFYKQIELDGNVENGHEANAIYGSHFPVMNAPDLAVFREAAVVFQLSATRTGLMIVTRRKANTADMQQFITEQGIGTLLSTL